MGEASLSSCCMDIKVHGDYGRRQWLIWVRFTAPMPWIFGALANRVQNAKPMPCRILSASSINSWNNSELLVLRWWDTAWVEPLAWLSPSNIPSASARLSSLALPLSDRRYSFSPGCLAIAHLDGLPIIIFGSINLFI